MLARRLKGTPALYDHGQPIHRPNLAPLAAVWAIAAALAMSVYINPSHALTIDLPMPSPYSPDSVDPLPFHRVSVSRTGQAIIDGSPVTDGRLAQHMDAFLREPIEPAIVFDPSADAQYGRVLEVLAIVRRKGLAGSRFCFANLADHQRFGKAWQNYPMPFAPTLPEAKAPGIPRPSEPPTQTLEYRLPPVICDDFADREPSPLPTPDGAA